jgi:pimeloyl-ACP methyl ester carboxylesterase
MAGLPASYFCIKAFSETDLTEDLKKFSVATLILHGDADQIVPIADSAPLPSKIVKNAALKVYEGAPHGMRTTLKDRVSEELLAFIRALRPVQIWKGSQCHGNREIPTTACGYHRTAIESRTQRGE